MPRFLFNGFDLGSSVAITAAQGGLSDSASVASWGDDGAPTTGTGELSIIPPFTAGKVTAPAGVWFSVDLDSLSNFSGADGNPISGPTGGQEYDPRYHEVTYIWDFDDPGQFGTPLNMPTVWNNKNIAYGPRVAHVFSAPGTYDVTVWAIDSTGNTGVANTTITVVDADTVYTGARTIYFDPTSTWVDSPSGANQVSTVSALQGAINGLTQPGRILIAKGISQNNFALDLNSRPVEYVGTRGSGARPVLTNPNVASDKGMNWGNTAATNQITITGLAQRGHWDSTVVGGGSAQALIEPFDVRRVNGDMHFTVYDCDFSGFNWINIIGDREYISTTIMSDCRITNWEDYGLFANQVHLGGYNRYAVVGCSIFQNVDALGGDSGKGSRDNEHGPIRIQENQEVYLGCLDLFSRNGWAGGQATPSCQPCIRMNTNGARGHMYNLERCVGENGGEAVFIANPENDASQSVPGNYLYDKLLAVGTAQSRTALFENTFGGATFRNCLGIYPNVPSEYSADFLEAHTGFKAVPTNSGTGNYGEPISIYNCTIVNLRNNANDSGHIQEFSSIAAEFTAVTEENNIHHSPNTDTPVTADAPIDLTNPIAGFTPRFKGLKFTLSPSLDTSFANPSTVPQPTPQAGSRALNGTGQGLTAHDDFLLTPRGDPETLGAFET